MSNTGWPGFWPKTIQHAAGGQATSQACPHKPRKTAAKYYFDIARHLWYNRKLQAMNVERVLAIDLEKDIP
jgi:hypothetical protein